MKKSWKKKAPRQLAKHSGRQLLIIEKTDAQNKSGGYVKN